MPKDRKKIKQKNIQLNIKEAFVVVDRFLPKHYTADVLIKVPWSNRNQIRVVRNRKSGDIRIIKALKEVAEETKKILK